MANASNTNHSRIYKHSPLPVPTKATFAAVFFLCGAIGFIGNTLVLVFERKKRKAADTPSKRRAFERSLTLYLLKSLALTDLLCSLMGPPLYLNMLYENHTENWHCVVNSILIFCFPIITILNLVVISLDRYMAVFHPFRTFTRAFAKKLVMAAWIVGAILAVVLALPVKNMYTELDESVYTFLCIGSSKEVWEKVVIGVITILVYLVPNAIMFYAAVTVSRFLRKRSREIQDSANIHSNNSQGRRFKHTKMFINVIFAFCIPYSFFFVYNLVKRFAGLELSYELDFTIRMSGGVLATSNSCINPMIYLFFYKDFRRELRNIICPRQVVYDVSRQRQDLYMAGRSEGRNRAGPNLPNIPEQKNTIETRL
ncbi:neuromedin-U receptor 2-like [Nematostella vectensis]|uniref:neuromedin-U receptor 2-like n=1 Tax=Nematostella vectensis TaxID=45351 RepID=UPI002076F738|nr:neuromedin-U receptor 2-like [Nematostella vectensis]